MAFAGVDFWIIVGYFAAMIAVGVYASRKVQGADDFAVAGRQLGLPILSGTLIGSAIGAAATFGKAGKAYEVGFVILFSSLAYMLGYLILTQLAPKLRAANIDTIPDALEMRYGKVMRVTAALVMSIAVVSIFGAQLIAFGITAATVLADFGINYQQAVLAGAFIIVVYTLIGGMLAVAITDLVQVGIMVIAIGIILPVCLTMDLGSEYALAEVMQSPAQEFMAGLDLSYLLAFIPTYAAFVLIDPSIWQRCASARNASDLPKAMWLVVLTYGFWSLVVVTLGVVAFNVLPTLSSGDAAISTLVMEYMPPVARGLCLAAILAIMMSTADSVLLVAGTTVSGDIVKPLKPNLTSQHQLLINRGVILLIGIVGAFFALERSGIFDVMMLSLAIFVSGLFIPVMGALFWKKATTAAAVVSALVGVSLELVLFALKKAQIFDLGIEPILVAIVASALSFWLVGLLTWNERCRGPLLITSGRQPLQSSAV